MTTQEPSDPTLALLRAWRDEQDESALERLLEQHLEFVRALARQKLGPRLREHLESMDVVQEVAMEVLRNGPRFVVSDAGHLRGLLARLVENRIRDRARQLRAAKRDVEREDARASIDLSSGGQGPGTVVAESERRELVRLGVELLEEDDRQVVWLHQIEERPMAEVAELLGLKATTAHMRYQRAVPRLALKLQELLRGELPES